MAGTFMKLMGEVFKALQEAGNPSPAHTGRQQVRQIPLPIVTALLKENKKEEAIAFLQRTMNWDEARARNFTDGLQPTASLQRTQKTAQRAHTNAAHSQTHIDKIINEYAEAENNASGNLFTYFFKIKR